MVAREQGGRPVLSEDLAQVGQDRGGGVAEQIDHAHQPGAGQPGDPFGGRRLVTGQVEQVVALVLRQSQRTRQGAQELDRWLTAAALFQAYDVIRRHAREHRHLLPAQAAGAAAGACGDARFLGTDRLAAAAQEVGELFTLHTSMVAPGRRCIQGAALPG